MSASDDRPPKYSKRRRAALDPFGKIPKFKFCAATVEPVTRIARDLIPPSYWRT
jgi:hypothetical protein